MRPEIETYLREHGARYTPEALRKALVEAGHDPIEADAALTEWQTGAPDGARTPIRHGRFWLWAFGLHAAVLVLIGILSAASGGLAAAGAIALVILAPVLLLGFVVTGAIGRAALAGRGLGVALIAPALSAVVIGGSCLAFGGSLLFVRPPPPATSGVMNLEIEPPMVFAGSGAAHCQEHRDATGFSVYSESLGTLDGRQVSVSLESYAVSGTEPAPAPAPGEEASYSLIISLGPSEGEQPGDRPEDQPVDYVNVPTSRVTLDASVDGRSGSAVFEGLESMMEVPPDEERPEPISGRITWSCQ